MLSSNVSWHFFARGNRVYKTLFIYQVLETQFVCDVSIHVGATWKLSLRDSVSNRVFFKNKASLMPVSLSLSHIPLHSLSLTFPLTPPSHPLHPLTLAFLHPLTVALRHPHTDTLSCSCLSHSHGYLTHPLHYQSVSTLKHRLHLSVSSLKYDFLIVWFFHVGLWFLFQSYDWFDCFVCYSVWFPRKCEKNLFGILCWDWCLFISNFK